MPLSVSSLFRLVALAALALPAGCIGYQVGNQSLYRPDIHTVSVQMFASNSYRRHLGEQLTEAVIKEIESKTPFKVVDAATADSTLTGRLISYDKAAAVENQYDDVREIATTLYVEVTWADRRGEIISQRTPILLDPMLIGVTQGGHIVPEAGQSIATGQLEAIGRLAEQIVGQMEMPW